MTKIAPKDAMTFVLDVFFGSSTSTGKSNKSSVTFFAFQVYMLLLSLAEATF